MMFKDINGPTTLDGLESEQGKEDPELNDDEADDRSYLTTSSGNSTMEGANDLEEGILQLRS